ncbi:ribonuclease VapC [Mesorhizobium sp. L-8-10]|uniref:type II toxin-antitoxin system VapC family toxin n=1 Tax=unclassified Mesorhizobium TaxID=325217 RepID=UPI001925EBB4|nr:MULTISPECIES: type II toxin-antitoxin system VapC family toxin [unclassified Mesorhizobium]BCH22851.1 ribonuclease VapC [Mesorhizobium sp. L-8-3]BCH30656.1 ribonuclease VapC [Mesorhizobium sp. L-8-10]
MNTRYMLDTNAIGLIVTKRSGPVADRHSKIPPQDICVSAISFGEIQFGLAKRPEATRLAGVTADFFAEVDVLQWSAQEARLYGHLRAHMERQAKSLGALDMLIAAHALSVGATLVTSDRAFRLVPDLRIEDWLEG